MFEIDSYDARNMTIGWHLGGFQGARGQSTGGEWYSFIHSFIHQFIYIYSFIKPKRSKEKKKERSSKKEVTYLKVRGRDL